jgi:hypothetical protein
LAKRSDDLEATKFERTVKWLLAMPPKPREQMKIGKPKAKKAASPKRSRPDSQARGKGV